MEALKIVAQQHQDGILTDREFLARVLGIVGDLWTVMPDTTDNQTVAAFAKLLIGVR